MSHILIAFATGEGQTARITEALVSQFRALGHTVSHADLEDRALHPDPAAHDAVIVAASVHAGRHEKRALRFARRHRDALSQRPNAFLSVSMSAASSNEAGQQKADEQVETFLGQSGWRPEQVETIAGAFRLSRLPPLRRWIMRRMLGLFRKELDRLGWPEDLTHDHEYTDWDALRGFGERFAARLPPPLERAG